MPITNPQEKTTAVLAAILFFLPHFMSTKTEFVTFYMRQSFGIFVVFFVLSILSAIPFIGFIFIICNFFVFLAWGFHVYSAYSGEKMEIPLLLKYTDICISKVDFLQKFFAPKN